MSKLMVSCIAVVFSLVMGFNAFGAAGQVIGNDTIVVPFPMGEPCPEGLDLYYEICDHRTESPQEFLPASGPRGELDLWVRVWLTGDSDDFDYYFPDGITLSVYNSGGLDDSTTLSINTLTEIDNISSAESLITLSGKAYNYGARDALQQFGLQIRYYLEYPGPHAAYEGGNDGALQVKPNAKTDFDAFRFPIDFSTGTESIYIDPGIAAKVPTWLEEVRLQDVSSSYYLPDYMEKWGWSYQSGDLKLDMGTFGYYFFDFNQNSNDVTGRKLLSTITHYEEGGSNPTALWTYSYIAGSDRIDKIEGPTDAPRYDFTWTAASGDYDLDVAYEEKSGGSYGEVRGWHAEYDDDNNLKQNPSGCVSCGDGGVDITYEYYDVDDEDGRWLGLLKEITDANNVVILHNTYTDAVHGADYLPRPLLEESYATEPVGESTVKYKFVEWEYSSTGAWAVEKTYVDNTNYRLKKYVFADDTFSRVTRKIDFEELNDDPNAPAGKIFITEFDYSWNATDEVFEQTVIYPSGRKKTYQLFDEDGVLAETYLYDVVNSQEVDNTYYSINNDYLPSQRQDPKGSVWQYTYNNDDFLEWVYDPNHTVGISPTNKILRTYLTYDDAQRLIGTEKSSHNASATEYLNKSSLWYDNRDIDYATWGLLREQTINYDHSGSSYGSSATTEYIYDQFGRVIRTISPSNVISGVSYNTAGQVEKRYVFATNLASNVVSLTRMTYDDNGKVTQVEVAKEDSSIDPNSLGGVTFTTTLNTYDFLGRNVSTIQDSDVLHLVTETSYNNQGQVTKTTGPNGAWTKTTYDGRGLAIQTIAGYMSSGEEVVYSYTNFYYDVNGNLAERVDPDGGRTFYTYDHLDRPLQNIR
ncbi:MAG: RHS repeat protein [Planctomycetes bacterium]|nr:RHS repeat protein [Planctomycetota bacterium]